MPRNRKRYRNGGSIRGRHKAVSDFSGKVVDLLRRMEGVTIFLGEIDPRVKAGFRRIKIKKLERNEILLLVFGNGCRQEIFVHVEGDVQEKKEALAQRLRIKLKGKVLVGE